jgi:hypothetical protein
MSDKWRVWCEGFSDIAPIGKGKKIRVTLCTGRTQDVAVAELDDRWEFSSVILQGTNVSIKDLAVRMARRNRTSRSIGVKFGEDDVLVASSWLPRVGATKNDFLARLRRVAAVADLQEYQLP